jgi:hypothetical protein
VIDERLPVRIVVMSERKAKIKEKAISEGKKIVVVVVYLWALFAMFQVHKIAILRGENMATAIGYQVGLALINALVIGKVILIAQAFHVGERYQDKPLIYPILFKSALFSVLLVCFEIVEEVVVGMFHHKTIAESMPALGGGGVEGILLSVFMAFIALIPFFAFTEVGRVLGEDELASMLFRRRII